MSRAKLAEYLLTAVAALAVGYVYFSLNDPISRDIRSWFGGGVAPDIPINDEIDNVISTAMPPEGNIVLDLPALVRDPGVKPDAVGRIFARGTYLIWPRRFYAVPPSNVVVWARDMHNMTAPEDPRWLADHDVRFYARIYFHPVQLYRRRIGTQE